MKNICDTCTKKAQCAWSNAPGGITLCDEYTEIPPETCSCPTGRYHDLEQGDTLYRYGSWDGGLEFNYIHNIKYCPLCGKLLPGEEE